MGPVVEGPPAVWVAAGFQPLPGAVPLRVADHQQQVEQPGFDPAGGLGPEADLPTGPDLQGGPGVLGDGLDGVEVAGRGRGPPPLATSMARMPSRTRRARQHRAG